MTETHSRLVAVEEVRRIHVVKAVDAGATGIVSGRRCSGRIIMGTRRLKNLRLEKV